MRSAIFALCLFLCGVAYPQIGHSEEQTYSTEEIAAADALYNEAFELYVAGEKVRAMARLKEVERKYPGTKAAEESRRLLDIAEIKEAETSEPKVEEGVSETPTIEQTAEPPRETNVFGVPEPTRNERARYELVIGQAVHGLFLGGELCIVLGCSTDSDAFPTSIIAGGAVGLGLMIGLTDSEVDPGLSSSVNSGTLWGGWQALALYGGTGSTLDDRASAALFMGAQIAGTLGGFGAYRALGLTEDHVAVGNTLGIWSGVTGTLIHASLIDSDYDQLFISALIIGDIGLVSGLLWAPHSGLSRMQTFALDVGAVLGGMLAAGVPLMFGMDDFSERWAYFRMAIGIPTGMSLAYLLTSHWNSDEEPLGSLSIYPTDSGAAMGWMGRF